MRIAAGGQERTGDRHREDEVGGVDRVTTSYALPQWPEHAPHAARHQRPGRIQPEAKRRPLLTFTGQRDLGSEDLPHDRVARSPCTDTTTLQDRQPPRPVGVQVDRVLAGNDAAGEAVLVVEAGRVEHGAQVVAEQVEHRPALVGVADRDIARGLHPEIDVAAIAVRPTHPTITAPGGLMSPRWWRSPLLLDELSEEETQQQDADQRPEQVQVDDAAAVRAIR